MAKVKFLQSGYELSVPSGMDFQELHRKYPHLPLKFGCTRGDCGVCAIRVVEGEENLTKKSAKEETTLKAKGLEGREYRLACQCGFNGDISLDR